MKHKRVLVPGASAVLVIAIAACALILWHRTKSHQKERQEGISIVILDSGNYYESDAGIDGGIKMAIKNVEEKLGIPISIRTVDDGGDYVKGIAMAKSLAEDPGTDCVISFQNFESIGPEVPFFEEAKKPFISTMGCYDEVAGNEYEYFLADFMSGKSTGEQIGKYLLEHGAKNIALCHSDTTFEKDEIKGIQSVVRQAEGVAVACTRTGPFQDTELADLLVQCSRLEIDTVVANFYNQEDCAWLLGQLNKKLPSLTLVGDYALDSEDILEKYGENLEHVTLVPNYPYQQSELLDKFIQDYQITTGQNFSTAAVQYYDLINMLATYWNQSGRESKKMMSLIRSEQGYSGVSGQICFDAKGCLNVQTCPVYECHRGEFVRKQEG